MRAFEQNIRKTQPYIPGEQPRHKVIKLNTNENPYPPAPGVEQVLKEFDVNGLRLYPDPEAEELTDALAKYYEVKKEQVFVGVGSDDVLAMCFLTFFNSDKPILFPDISYSFYKVWAELYRIPYECPVLDKDFRIRKEEYMRPNGGIIFPNPNAPTSVYENLDLIREIVSRNRDVIVIVDEAYIDFAGASALELIAEYDNLIVVQTFSKARSMAGMRIGYAIGDSRLIKYLQDAKYSFNSYTMNQTSLIAGVAAVNEKEYFKETTRKIISTREWVKKELAEMGFVFPEPSGNFIFARHPRYEGETLFQALKEAGIYVRFWPKERIDQYLRITIGTREEMEKLLTFLKNFI